MGSTLKHWIVLLFFALHAFSIGVESIPSDVENPLTRGVRFFFQPMTNMYINATAQWQNWNLFAPDPFKESILFTVESLTPSGTLESRAITPHSIPWYSRTNTFKFFRFLSRDGEKYVEARRAFLHSLCTRWDFPPGTLLHLQKRVTQVLDPMESREFADVSVSCALPES
ncbi:MAG TPA: hypothetical protein VJB60_02310 [Candidatus Peribacterales bacterium]|nr:hypothetical protein [Candidatus Peribacterales bacterium]